MKRQLSTIALSLALMSSLTGFSQSQAIQPCNTYAAMEQHFAEFPEARSKYDAEQAKLQKSYLNAEANHGAGKAALVQYTVPVVFHVLHTGGSENVADGQIIAALKQMNSDYGRMGSDTGTIFAPFKSLYVNSDIIFVLAKKDPNGNCTNGIRHLYDTRTDWSQASAGSGSSAYYNGLVWDPTKYMNVIIVKQIIGANPSPGTIVGYTYKPGTWNTGNLHDCIIYHYGFLAGLNARSLTHEAGHWLNLTHTFGNTNNPGVSCGSTAGGDGIADTPDTKGNFSTCPASSTNTAYTCTSPNPGNSNNYYQNVNNFMDYSSCAKNFTQGQTTAMRNALQSTVSGRNNLISAANLAFTDVASSGNCAPVAEFLSTTNSYTVCVGSSLSFKDYSYNGTITSYSWTGTTGLTFASPASAVTGATFGSAGIATVSLTVSNSIGSSVKTRTVTVINPGTALALPYGESFEATALPANWSIINPNANVTWALTNSAALTGANSIFLDGTTSPASEIDILNMPLIDIVNNPTDTFTFKVAYARYSTTTNDIFKVEASKDCGATWGTIYGPSAGLLASTSGGVSTAPFVPTLSQWTHVNLNIYPTWNTYASSASVMVRFSFQRSTTGTGGNNIYLDDINFSGIGQVGVNELSKNIHFGLYPNPTNGEAVVKFKLNDAALINLDVVDVIGRKVLPSTNINVGSGEQSISINKNKTLSAGIYFVNLSVNGAKMSKKLIIE